VLETQTTKNMMIVKKNNILVAMEGSESSLKAYEYAIFLAKQFGSALIIVNICDIFENITDTIRRELL
jgi:nucleotide-binding universal stress UspA family protein